MLSHERTKVLRRLEHYKSQRKMEWLWMSVSLFLGTMNFIAGDTLGTIVGFLFLVVVAWEFSQIQRLTKEIETDEARLARMDRSS